MEYIVTTCNQLIAIFCCRRSTEIELSIRSGRKSKSVNNFVVAVLSPPGSWRWDYGFLMDLTYSTLEQLLSTCFNIQLAQTRPTKTHPKPMDSKDGAVAPCERCIIVPGIGNMDVIDGWSSVIVVFFAFHVFCGNVTCWDAPTNGGNARKWLHQCQKEQLVWSCSRGASRDPWHLFQLLSRLAT